MIEKHVTSLELSRRLWELGVRKPSIFYWVKLHKNKKNMKCCWDRYPAYTTSELLEMLPKRIRSIDYAPEDENAEYGQLIIVSRSKGFFVFYAEEEHGDDVLFMGHDEIEDEFVQNALAKMRIYLAENKLVGVEEINKCQ